MPQEMYSPLLFATSPLKGCITSKKFTKYAVRCFLLLKWDMGGSCKMLCIAVSFGLQRTFMQIHEYYQELKLNYQGFIITWWEYLGEWGDRGTTSGKDEALSSHKGLAT